MTHAGSHPDNPSTRTILPGAQGVLRYTNDEEFLDAPRGHWWPDDEDDFLDQMRNILANERIVRIRAVLDSGGCPDIDICAGVVLVPAAPWGCEPDSPSAALVIQGDATLTVITYPTLALSEAAFIDHVRAREHAGHAYDYVTRPGQPRTTAWPC